MRRHLVRVLTVLSLLAAALVLPSPAQAGPLTFQAVADATVAEEDPDDNFGDDDVLLADERPEMEALVQFQVGELDGPVSFARLRLWVVNRTWNGPEVWLSGQFDEDTVTWDSGRPTLHRLMANLGSVSEGEWVEIDVTDAIDGPGTYAFTVVSESSDGVDFTSREGPSSQRPELVVETSSSSSSSSTTTAGSSSTTTTTAGSSSTTTTGGSQSPEGPFRAVADTSVEEDDPDDTHGSDSEVLADDSPVKRGLLRFQVPSGVEENATYLLRLYVTDSSSDGPEVWTTGTFDEASVTWATGPSLGRMVGDFGSVSSGNWVEIDVSSEVDGPGTYAFALVGDSSNGADFASRESGANGPQLAISDAGGTTTSSTTSVSTTTASSTSTTSTTSRSTTTTTTGGSGSSGGPFLAVADSTVEQDDPDDANGSAGFVLADGTPVKRGLFRFGVPEGAAKDAAYVLRLYVTNSSSDGPEVWTTGSFDEASVTWATAPSLGRLVADFGWVSSGSWVEIDVSSEVDGPGTYFFALVGDSSDGADFASRESGANAPQLAIRDSDGTTTTTRPPGSGGVFEVGLIGDTGYKPVQVEALDDTVDDMNRLGMTFGMHAGDIWGGNTSCSDSKYKSTKAQFNDFDGAFVYTPGDNEWEDCTTSSSSRLSYLRNQFFSTDDSLGRAPIRLSRQSGQPENARWVHNGVVFATMNEPGSTGSSGSMKDNNVAWLNDAFDEAERIDAAGVLIMWQDNPFRPSGGTLYRELKERTIDFGKPVTLVHGDTHQYEVDHPWSDAGNFTRVEVFGGSDDGEWVRATIDPNSSEVFSFTRERP